MYYILKQSFLLFGRELLQTIATIINPGKWGVTMTIVNYVQMGQVHAIANGLGATGITTRRLTHQILYVPEMDDGLDFSALVYPKATVRDFNLRVRL